jgi:hypothetical protein
MKHSFNVTLASQIGIIAAIIADSIVYWCNINQKKGINLADGCYWMYQSYGNLSKRHPYITPKQVRTAIYKLKNEGFIFIRNNPDNKRDRTNWYAPTAKLSNILVSQTTAANAKSDRGTSDLPAKSDVTKGKNSSRNKNNSYSKFFNSSHSECVEDIHRAKAEMGGF